MALADQIGQAAGGGDQDVDAARELADLRAARDPAQHQRGRDPGAAGQRTDVLLDLDRQFAGRGQDQGAAGLRRRAAREADDVMQHRQREGSGLAGAGLDDAEDVAPVELRLDRLRLDRGRSDEAGALQRGRQRSGEAELFERSYRQNVSFPPVPASGRATAVLSQAKRIWRGRLWGDRARIPRAALSLPRGDRAAVFPACRHVREEERVRTGAHSRLATRYPFPAGGAWRAYAALRAKMQGQSAF